MCSDVLWQPCSFIWLHVQRQYSDIFLTSCMCPFKTKYTLHKPSKITVEHICALSDCPTQSEILNFPALVLVEHANRLHSGWGAAEITSTLLDTQTLLCGAYQHPLTYFNSYVNQFWSWQRQSPLIVSHVGILTAADWKNLQFESL